MLPRAFLDERQVGLADGGAEVPFDAANQLGLGERPPESPQVSFKVPQLLELLGESHCN
jgi:hypothetical protein